LTDITKITGDASLITLSLGQILERCKRMCGREAGNFQNPVYIEWVDQVMGELFGDAKQKWIEAESQFETEDQFQGPTAGEETGLATFTEGDETVTFEVGTVLPAEVVGKKIQMTGDTTGYEVVTRTSDTELEMKFKFMLETATNVTYQIVQDTYTLQSDFESAKLIDQHFSNLNMTLVRSLPVGFKISKRPSVASINKDKTITIYPAPNRVIHITYEYFRLFALRTADLTVETQLPDMWAQYLCYGVARNFWLTQAHRLGIAMARQFSELFREGKMAIRMDKYKWDGELVQFTPYRQPGVSSLQTGVEQTTFAQDLLAQ
jgi:hypothetical protein